jgi:hypothetical protein
VLLVFYHCSTEGATDRFHRYVRVGVFPFLKLPGELRNRIYEYFFTDTRGPQDLADPVIFINDLNRRKERRGTQGNRPVRTGLSNKSLKLARKHDILNNNGINTSRLKKRITGLPHLLETNVLRVCRQMYEEGSGVMWEVNVFAIAVPTSDTTGGDGQLSSLFATAGVDVKQIQHLRLEIQLGTCLSPEFQRLRSLKTKQWAPLRSMVELKTLRIIATFDQNSNIRCDHFHRFWHELRFYNMIFQELIEAVPKSVAITMGLTKEEKFLGDYAGWCPVKGCVLRKIYHTYQGLQGTYLETVDEGQLQASRMYELPVDGNRDDSDEETE